MADIQDLTLRGEQRDRAAPKGQSSTGVNSTDRRNKYGVYVGTAP
jgi:hypothetical protein